MSERAIELCQRVGVPLDVAEQAAAESKLLPTIVDYALGPGPPTFTVDEASQAAGTDVATMRRWWRAMGFADPPDDEPIATDLDVRALATTAAQMGTERWALQQARAVGSAMARIVEVWAEPLQELYDSGFGDAEMVEFAATAFDFDRLAFLIDFVHRRQMQLVMHRLAARALDKHGSVHATVGFVDLVNYTGLARASSPTELLEMLERFEEASFDVVAEHGGRLVKMIGDEVMFVTDQPDGAVRIACALIERAQADALPMIHAGLASGPVSARQGDYYGNTVNLANRAVGVAPPGTVAVTRDFAAGIATHVSIETLGWRKLKGFDAELDLVLLRP